MCLPVESVEQFVATLSALPRAPGDHIAGFLANAHEPQLDAMVAALNDPGLPFFGGVVPALVDSRTVRHEGAIVRTVPLHDVPVVATIGDDHVAWGNPRPNADAFTSKKTTAPVISDYWSPNVSRLLAELFDVFGASVKYWGMGAGTLERRKSRCVFTTKGRFEDSALVTFMSLESDSHLRHGWRRVAGPLAATRTRHNVASRPTGTATGSSELRARPHACWRKWNNARSRRSRSSKPTMNSTRA